jgi:hypothetical protein
MLIVIMVLNVAYKQFVLNVDMLSVVRLNVVMVNVVIVSVMAPPNS